MVAEEPVRAAGVVVVRHVGEPDRACPEVLVVHRPHRVDWSLPKGKLDPGEHVLTAAVRECDEETGVVPVLGVPLAEQSYVALGRPKVVQYWAAAVGGDEGFTPDDEIDEIRWMEPEQAVGLLTYPRDGDLVRTAVALPATSPMIVLRHTQAMKRSDYKGDHDDRRPLSGKGRSQARALVPLLSAYGIREVHSSDAARCHETVRRFADAAKRRVMHEPLLSEEGHEKHPGAARKRVVALARRTAPLVVCTHRPVLPDVMETLATLPGADADHPAMDPKLAPGSFVVVHRRFDEDGRVAVVAVERHDLAAKA